MTQAKSGGIHVWVSLWSLPPMRGHTANTSPSHENAANGCDISAQGIPWESASKVFIGTSQVGTLYLIHNQTPEGWQMFIMRHMVYTNSLGTFWVPNSYVPARGLPCKETKDSNFRAALLTFLHRGLFGCILRNYYTCVSSVLVQNEIDAEFFFIA